MFVGRDRERGEIHGCCSGSCLVVWPPKYQVLAIFRCNRAHRAHLKYEDILYMSA